MAAAKKKPSKRKYLRFRPDPNAFAILNKKSVGLIIDEAYGGCGVAIVSTDEFQKGDYCNVQVGRLGPMKAEIVWRKELDDQIIKIGLRYIE